MTDNQNIDALSRAPGRDEVLPFAVEALDVHGRVVTLNDSLNDILARHQYPKSVSKLLAQAAALTIMLAASVKLEGRLTLQAQSDGAASLLVVDIRAEGGYRATAKFDESRVAEFDASGETEVGALLGKGTLAMTIEQGVYTNRYQGFVALDGGSLEEAAHEYFLRSEQIPTRIRLAVSEVLTRTDGEAASHAWQASGMMVQFLPQSSERLAQRDLPGDGVVDETYLAGLPDEDDAWNEVRALIDTVADHELVDPELSSQRLLYRLFHESGVRVFDPESVEEGCSCAPEKVSNVLEQLSPEALAESITDKGDIDVKCDFCGRQYTFDPKEFAKPS
ncbi:MAG: Hsp33 family molecular chaperone [Rhizobiales bacterium]|nr:Hsp33 family molecular chaperone [Hyphomicrobiales bacterium]